MIVHNQGQISVNGTVYVKCNNDNKSYLYNVVTWFMKCIQQILNTLTIISTFVVVHY